VKLLTVDLPSPLPDVASPSIGEQWVLVRLHGEPLGILKFAGRGCSSHRLSQLIAERLGIRILRHLAADALADPARPLALGGADCPQRTHFDRPRVTVAVCTRNGSDRLGECLDAVLALDYPVDRIERLVVDNAPQDDAVGRLVASRYPSVRYVVEPIPGLDRARNRAISAASGDIIAFTDDDVSVDPAWVDNLARIFAFEPDVDAVTGLVVADEIDVESQRLFEDYGGFARGFDRLYFRVDTVSRERAARRHGGAGKLGTGANMAFRRGVFDRIGQFDPALDVGTPTNGGGDLEMFFRVLKSGGTLVYEPSAIVRHRHRRTYEGLRTQLTNNGIGFYSYLVRSARHHPDERGALLKLGAWWLWRWNLQRLLRALVRPSFFPRDLILAELRGSIVGLRRYPQALIAARALDAASEPSAADGSMR
jgi:glycosyltransferase involved in cell wall biosynthesis